jgi:plastocyanin
MSNCLRIEQADVHWWVEYQGHLHFQHPMARRDINPMPLSRRIPILICVIACGLATRVIAAPPTTQPVSSVTGIVTAESEVPLSEMVVFLESPDADRVMPPPTTQPVMVSQKGAQFEPRLTVVTVGQSVGFVNDEDRQIEHNVFSNSAAKRFDLGLYGPGKAKSVTFDKPGPVFLYCSIHRYMDGVVFVSPTPYTSRVNENGKYTIENVPAGTWTVKTWQQRRRFKEQNVPVTVAADKPSVVNMELVKPGAANTEPRK